MNIQLTNEDVWLIKSLAESRKNHLKNQINEQEKETSDYLLVENLERLIEKLSYENLKNG